MTGNNGNKHNSNVDGYKPRKNRLPRFVKLAGSAVALAIVFVAGIGFHSVIQANQQSSDTKQPTNEVGNNLSKSLTSERVAVYGGSAAHGSYDPNDDSYLRRAFAARSAATNVNYQYLDHTVVGGTAHVMETKTPGRFEQQLRTYKPQVVVFSWGILNDISSRHKVSVTVFGDSVKQQIGEALAAHAVVIIATPPVTKMALTDDRQSMETYINELFNVANSFHSPNVFEFDVYHQMESYMTAHNQTIDMYWGNNWHPNGAGHILAGELLADDMIQQFGVGPIAWKGNA